MKDELRRNTDEAIARGVFGVPTLAIGDELFWGATRPRWRRLRGAGCRFDDPEYARVASLPEGVQRSAAKDPTKKSKTRIVGTAS